jgi:MOSC domain-containing protein YiiM
MTRGIVVSLNISAGGVPKLPIRSAELGETGFAGDGHDDMKHHGGPERAVCIYSVELIEALRREGHSISAGSAGENLTISGLEWRIMVPGARLRIGETMVELTSYASPCKTIRDSFIKGIFKRISQKENPGWSRVYGKVLSGGVVRVGDLIVMAGV